MRTIAYIIPKFPVLSETFIGTEIRAMEKLGHTIIPISLQRPDQDGFQRYDDELAGRTRFIDEVNLPDILKALSKLRPGVFDALKFASSQQGTSVKSLLFVAAKVMALLRATDCQHVHAHFAQATTAVAIVVARAMGISVSFVGHGHDIYESPSDLPLKLQSTDLAVSVCKDMQNDFKHLAAGVHTHLVYCGIDHERFCATDIEFRPFPENKLLFVGRLCETKGIEDILYALALIPADERPALDIVGDGPLKEALLSLSNQLGLDSQVRFLGSQYSEWIIENAPSYRAFISAFKESSTGNRDTGPVVIKEAMALGLPIVTTAFMGCKEMLDKQSGFLVSPGSQRELSQAITKVVGLPEAQWRSIALNARKRVISLFTAEQQAKRLSQAIQHLHLPEGS